MTVQEVIPAASAEIVVAPPRETALDVFSTAGGLEPYLSQVRAAIDAFVPDASTAKGRAEIASMAHKVARSKSALDNVGKDLVAELKELPKKIDAERKRMRDTLDAWKDDVRRPLTDWENAEADRKAVHVAFVESITAGGVGVDELQSTFIQSRIDTLNALVIDAALEEYEQAATDARVAALAALHAALPARLKSEADQAELERLRREASEREIVERVRRENEEKQKADMLAAARREADAVAAADRARLQAEEAQRRADLAVQQSEQRAADAAAAERKRIADEEARAAAELAAREADVAHRKTVNNAALAALIGAGVPNDVARNVVKMIVTGKVPGVVIQY